MPIERRHAALGFGVLAWLGCGALAQQGPPDWGPIPATLALERGTLRANVSPETGAVSRLVYVPTKTLVVQDVQDVYLLDGQRVSEATDRATGHRGAPAGTSGFEIRCRNEALPDVEIVKAYALDRGRLSKTIRFRGLSNKRRGRELFVRSRLRMAEDFYDNGQFYRPIWSSGGALGPGAVPFTPEANVTEPRGIKDGYNCMFGYVRPDIGLGVAHYKFNVNGHYEGLRAESFPLARATFEPGGWEIYLTGDIVRPGDFLSIESQLMVFEGDARSFHWNHLDLPGYAELTRPGVKLPDWFGKVKYVGVHTYPAFVKHADVRQRLERICATMGPDEYMMYLLADWSITGDYQTQGEILSTHGGPNRLRTTASEVKESIARCRQIAPRNLKLALYTWQHSASDQSKTYMRDHPEWLLRGPDGEPVTGGSGETYNYVKNVVTPQHVDWIADQYRKLVQYYKLDYTYIDGGVGGETINHKPEKSFTHLYHGLLAGRAIKKAAEETGAIHMQNVSVHPETAHSAYLETLSDAWAYDVKDWRILANIYWLSKCYQPHGWTNALNWADQNYASRSIMYGFPLEMCTPWYGFDLGYMFHMGDLSFEVRGSQLVRGDHMHPNWWAFETETLETALLKLGAAYLLPMIHHGKTPTRQKIAVNVEGLDLDAARPVYVWHFRPLVGHGLDWTAPPDAARPTVARTLEILEIRDGRLTFEADLRPGWLEMIAMTQTPGLVYSVRGRKNDFLLPASRGVTIDGAGDDEQIELKVTNEAGPSAVLVRLPHSWPGCVVRVNGGPVRPTRLTLGEHRFALVPIRKKRSRIVATKSAKPAGAAKPLDSPTINSYRYYALGFYPGEGRSTIRAHKKDGVACWAIAGPGTLENYLSVALKSTDGVAFRLHPGTAKGEFRVMAGNPAKRFVKAVPLNFEGWKEFAFSADQFDEIPGDLRFEDGGRFYFSAPEGTVYLADFRFLPLAEEKRGTAQRRKLRIEVRPTSTPPTLDGDLDDACWNGAATVTFGIGEKAANRTTLHLTYDKSNLYLSARCQEGITKPPSKLGRDNSNICNSPHVELFFRPVPDGPCYQLVTTPAGGRFDTSYAPGLPMDDTDWNAEWKVAAKVGWGVYWTAEIAIPFADLAVDPPKPGDTWDAGFFRQSPMGLSGWIYEGNRFYQPDKHFGQLVFAK